MPGSRMVTAAAIAAFSVGTAQAAPIIFGTNAYELIVVQSPYTGNNNSWSMADAAAQASVFMGVNGHLATVTSADENAFLAGLGIAANLPLEAAGFTGAWLGGRSGSGWLTGPENGNAFTYANFGGSEPNNAGFVYMAVSLNPGAAGLFNVGEWLDDSTASAGQGVPAPNSDPVIAYFVEYENVATVPVPAALPLLAGSLGLFGFWGRRR